MLAVLVLEVEVSGWQIPGFCWSAGLAKLGESQIQ